MRQRLKVLLVISIALLYCHIAAQAESNRLDLKFSSPKKLGDVVQSPLTQAVKIYRNSTGKYEAYFATNGTPATFNVVDVESGKLTFSERLSAIESVWGITQGSDGNIYFGNKGILVRYLPEEKKIEELGKNPSGPAIWDLEASEDGKIFGATYPAAKVFEYEINTGRFYDRGTVQPKEKYVRGLGISDGFLYAGVGSSIYLYKIDLKTFQKTEVLLPNTGTTGFVHNIEVIGNSVFVKAGSWFVLDKETNKVVGSFTSANTTLSPPAPHNPDLIYFAQAANLCTYNLKTHAVSKIDGIPALPEGLIQDLEWVTLTHGNHKGKTVLAGITNYAERFFYDPIDQWFDLITLKAASDGLRIKSIEADSERLYVGGYPKGMAIINLATDKLENIAARINQPEGTGFLNGKAYFGTYGGAIIYQYVPSHPFNFGEDANHNPGLIYDIGDSQDRPFAFASGDNKLFIGTVPGYGELGGALTIYDEALHAWKVHRNVVPGQSVVGLAYKDGKVYGGTSIWGGLGGDPLAKEAKIFVWDVEKKAKVAEFTPEIPQIDATPQIIGGLSFGPDGLLWGAIKGTIFAINPETYKVVKSRVIYPSNYRAHVWIPIYLRWGDDGLLYTTLGSHITVIDPKTLTYQTVVENVNFMALGKDGAIYYASKADLYKITTIGK